ncbi:hypothetical protein D0469_20620 [Peribacillus saganii]|uniref:Uncharacterized protein n=1 Tax=Peribacillus saganii TaxID=2303992 RepID=A0A372LAI4_9BACI|nr:hypothetical protein D0469_20620 [Peribacillus saganii]
MLPWYHLCSPLRIFSQKMRLNPVTWDIRQVILTAHKVGSMKQGACESFQPAGFTLFCHLSFTGLTHSLSFNFNCDYEGKTRLLSTLFFAVKQKNVK